MKQERFKRLEKIIGSDHLECLKEKTILVVGVGGVGGYVVESLVRSGIGTIILVDYDVIDITNINRQIIALTSTIGKKKVEVLKTRILDINPECKVITHDIFVDEDNIKELLVGTIDYVVDACDTMNAKKAIIKECFERDISVISSMGTGNKFDPTKLEITEIKKTEGDPLARIMRKWMKDEEINKKLTVLCSKELPVKTGDRSPGSTSFVPSAAGLIITSHIIREFLK